MQQNDTSNLTRVIPLEEMFMNKIDDILYGFLLIRATFDPNIKKLYLSNEKYLETRKEYMRIIKVSDRTIRNKVDKMIFLGYISKGSNRLIFN